VAWLPDDQRDRYLEHIQALVDEKHYEAPFSQIVFEGNAPAEVEKNRALFDLLTSPDSPELARTVQAWLGEPIAIRESVVANFRRQSGSNLLIVGQNDEAALGMTAVAIASLQARLAKVPSKKQSADDATFYLLDFGAVDAPRADFFSTLCQLLPIRVKIGRRRDLEGLMRQLASQVQRRVDADSGNSAPKYLIFYGLQRARDLRQEDSYSLSSMESGATSNPSKDFMSILRDGPEVGVHTLVWCDTLTNLNRNLDRRALREFSMRVVFQMTSEDSANLIDTPVASKLGPYRALFYSEEDGVLEKFRPYAPPSTAWLNWAGEQLKSRSNPPSDKPKT
jgi:S-DNA-T family DNA segregation ATPase FtsK/SpoIIIE